MSFTCRAALFCALSLGCGSQPEHLGQSPEILWWTDHETGDFSDWERDGEGSTWTAFEGDIQVVAGPARSGTHALRASVRSVAPPGRNLTSAGIAIRHGTPPAAYYSAWYYVPAKPITTKYWLVFKFRSRTTATDSASDVDVWDLDFVIGRRGALELSLYRHDVRTEVSQTELSVPIQRWFQIEAFLKPTSDSTGQLSVWQDGTLVFDVHGATMPSSFVEWNIGGITELIDPEPAVVYLDDAAISTERLGPSYPIFARAN